MDGKSASQADTYQAEVDSGSAVTPTIHERNINVKVIDPGGSQIQVNASLFDLEHNFHADLRVDIASGRIDDARVVMARRPYATYCLHAIDNVAQLKGEVIGRGINRRIMTLLGGRTGCFHLVELFLAAVGFTATILLGRRSSIQEAPGLPEEESRKLWFPVLKNTCQVFREGEPPSNKG